MNEMIKKFQHFYIGWYKEGKSDKVWGVVRLDNYDQAVIYHSNANYLIFWGRRGNKLQTKIAKTNWNEICYLISEKRIKGYVNVPPNKLDTVYPEFAADIEKTAIWTTLKL